MGRGSGLEIRGCAPAQELTADLITQKPGGLAVAAPRPRRLPTPTPAECSAQQP